MREQNLIGYDAVSGSTSLLQIANGKVRISPQVDVDKYIEHDTRWTKKALEDYVTLLNKFYKDSKFRVFFNRHRELYAHAEKELDTLLMTINTDWFQSFYGVELGQPNVYIGMSNGPHNYSFYSFLKNDLSRKGYGIVIGCSQLDDNNLPKFDKYFLPQVIIHEFAHHFTNPLIARFEEDLHYAGEKIYPHVAEQLAAIGYSGSRSMLIESFNNLFTNMYFKENPTFFDVYFVPNDQKRGYIWMRRAVSFMDNFYADRKSYRIIDDFFPQLIKFMDFTAEHIEAVKKECENEIPYVSNVYPAQNSIVDAYSIDTIRVEFSSPMNSYRAVPQNKENFDKYGPCSLSADGRVLLIPAGLKEKTSYSISVSGQSLSRFDTKQEFVVKFKTK